MNAQPEQQTCFCSPLLSGFLEPSSHQEESTTTSFELLLERRSRDLCMDALAEDIRTFHQGRITAVFAHHSFLRGLTETQQMQLFSSLPVDDLEEISLSSATISAKALIALLGRTQKLRKIYLDRVVLQCKTSQVMEQQSQLSQAVEGLDHLYDFHLSFGSGSGRGVSLLRVAGQEETVAMFAKHEAEDNLTPLVKALASTKVIRSVYLGYDLEDSDRPEIDPAALALLSQKTRHLILRHIPLGVQHVAGLASDSLQSLALLNSNLGDDGALALAQHLEEIKLPSLRKLFVAGNCISDKGGMAILQAIQTNPALQQQMKVLDVHCNTMTAHMAMALAKYIRMPTCQLKYLDLSWNNIGDETVIASALHENRTLEQLVLYQCGLGDKACKSFASSLSVNKTLKKLNLHQNDAITNDGIAAIGETLRNHNWTLQWLEVKAPAASPEHYAMKILDFFLKLNRSGRQQLLLQSTSETQFLNNGLVAATANKDVDSLFYLLCERPTMISNTVILEPVIPVMETPVTKAIAAKFEQQRISVLETPVTKAIAAKFEQQRRRRRPTSSGAKIMFAAQA